MVICSKTRDRERKEVASYRDGTRPRIVPASKATTTPLRMVRGVLFIKTSSKTGSLHWLQRPWKSDSYSDQCPQGIPNHDLRLSTVHCGVQASPACQTR